MEKKRHGIKRHARRQHAKLLAQQRFLCYRIGKRIISDYPDSEETTERYVQDHDVELTL